MAQHKNISSNIPGTMRWDGWGAFDALFDPGDRPSIWPYVANHLQIRPEWPKTPSIDPSKISPPDCRLTPGQKDALAEIFPDDRWSCSAMDRIVHAYGKSTRDIWRLRHGRLDFAPDAVVAPVTEDEIGALLNFARTNDVILIPFGGGSNVAGCLELFRADARPVVSANLRRFNQVLEIDTHSGFIRAEPGILGPDLEKALNAAGMTLGHFPDSFPYSTLGGWVATRSSGMMSDTYGNIEDMVVALRMLTPEGVIETHRVPQASNGPDPNWLCIGSEGTFGIITELTMRIRPLPPKRAFHGYLFPSFMDGLRALKQCSEQDISPMLSRLNDPSKTQLSAAFRHRESRGKKLIGRMFKAYLSAVRGFDLPNACLMVAAFQGDDAKVRHDRKAVERIYRANGAVALGRGPGEAFANGKYDFPYIRDFLMERGVICDVAETSTTWGGMADLYNQGMARIGAQLRTDKRPIWLGCHVSHTYPLGASIYFSYAFRCVIDDENTYDPEAELAYYAAVKKASLDCFAETGATLSHHHAVGYEHLPWLDRESKVGSGTMVDRIKRSLDPSAIMNPDKLTADFSAKALDDLLNPTARQTPPDDSPNNNGTRNAG
ncbi:MAG: FAD-binding oxidoreductase [Rhodospirillales bacterium]